MRASWFFGLLVYDVEAARRVARRKMFSAWKGERLARLLANVPVDPDHPAGSGRGIVAVADCGVREWCVIDGRGEAAGCLREGRTFYAVVLSDAESRACVIESESLGVWGQRP